MATSTMSQGQTVPEWNHYVSNTINAVSWSMTGVAAVFLGARIYTKAWKKRSMWWDDWVLILAWVMQLALAICLSVQVKLGFSQAPALIKPSHERPLAQLSDFTTGLGALASAWSKTSFALTLTRISGRNLRLGLWALIILVNIVQALNLILTFVHCRITPFDDAWTQKDHSSCWEPWVLGDYSIFASAFSAACDLVMVLLPWFVVLRLNMKRSEKIGIAICMSLGLIAGAITVYKTYVIYVFIFSIHGRVNGVFPGWKINIWTQVEVGATIVAAAIPALRSMFKQLHSTLDRKNYVKSGSHQLEQLNGKFSSSDFNKASRSSYRWDVSNMDTRDDGSESSIINVNNRDLPIGILATKEIRVNVDQEAQFNSRHTNLP